jgi:hypothetical protein
MHVKLREALKHGHFSTVLLSEQTAKDILTSLMNAGLLSPLPVIKALELRSADEVAANELYKAFKAHFVILPAMSQSTGFVFLCESQLQIKTFDLTRFKYKLVAL